MEEPADRLRQLRIKKGFETTADAAAAFGWNPNTYKSHENGERGIKLPVARQYASAFGSSASYILTGERAAPTISEVTSIPLMGVVAAGTFRPSDWLPEDQTAIPAVVRRDIPASRQYAVRVQGPSVNKRIADGMYAICAKFDSYPGGARLGSLVHVIREIGGEREHTVKEIRFTSSEGVLLVPVSDHPDHQTPLPYREGDSEVTIEGVVIGAYQPL